MEHASHKLSIKCLPNSINSSCFCSPFCFNGNMLHAATQATFLHAKNESNTVTKPMLSWPPSTSFVTCYIHSTGWHNGRGQHRQTWFLKWQRGRSPRAEVEANVAAAASGSLLAAFNLFRWAHSRLGQLNSALLQLSTKGAKSSSLGSLLNKMINLRCHLFPGEGEPGLPHESYTLRLRNNVKIDLAEAVKHAIKAR